jgi:predicted metal-dependent HD superfamily phosphohydrolase
MNKQLQPELTPFKLAAQLYSDKLPYHNFQHALKAVERGEEIVARCHEDGVEINDGVVRYALLFHDAGYHEDCLKRGHKTKEEYAAFLAGEALKKVELPEDLIKKVQEAIISTHHDAEFVTNEAKAVRAADLSNFGGPYEDFLNNTWLLKKEAEMISGREISWNDWRQRTKETVEFYLKQDIHLTHAYADEHGRSLFHLRARANLERFLQEKI